MDDKDPLAEYKANRKAYYDDYERSVQPDRDWQLESLKLSQEWARLGLRASFIMNGGALALLATLLKTVGGTLPFSDRAVMNAAWAFAVGAILAGACVAVAYVNFLRNAAGCRIDADNMAARLDCIYFKSAWPEQQLEASLEPRNKALFDVGLTMFLGVAFGVGSIVSFGIGAVILLG